MDTEKVITIRAKAFTGYGIEKIHAMVHTDGTVWVYDDVAKHYTNCHALSPRSQQKIRQLAGWSEKSAATRCGA
jgi:hypothetical protein